jgi:DNA-binding NtrC family response regulator
MSTALQSKLLRFMQDGEIRRIGGNEVRHVTVRVVAAANKNIDDEVGAGHFRLDLLYRFIVRLHIPPLRDRRADIPLLIEAMLKKLGYPNVRVSPEAVELLMAYDWPGNVRELENVLQQTLLLSPFIVILPENLPIRFRKAPDVPKGSDVAEMTPLAEVQREQILQTLKKTSWNQTKAADILGIDRKTLRMKIRRYGLQQDEK